jgi:hypothetical protein
MAISTVRICGEDEASSVARMSTNGAGEGFFYSHGEWWA